MALDPRISLAVASPTLTPAVNAFENALMNSQTRDIDQQQMAQAAIINPLIAEQNKIKTETARQNQRIGNTALTAQQLRPLLVEGIETGDTTRAEAFLTRNLTDIQRRQAAGENIDANETIEALQSLKAGGAKQLLSDSDGLIQIARDRGLLGGGAQQSQQAPASVRETEWFNQQSPEVQQSHLKIKRGDKLTQEEEISHKNALAEIDIATTKKKEDIKRTAGRTSELIKEYSVNRRAAKNSMVKLGQVAKLSEAATQGIAGQGKLLAARFFPGIDAKDEAALAGAFKGLALDELAKFKGPTTDFEFRVTEDVAGSLGDGASANKARTASLQRGSWFANKQADQFDEWVDKGHNPDRFSFNPNEVMTFGKGDKALTLTLQDNQDSAVAGHVSIDEAIKRLRESRGGK